MRIPEVRHNLRLITEACKTDLDGLAREAKTLQDRKRFIMQEDARLQIQVTQEAERKSFRNVHHVYIELMIFSNFTAAKGHASGGRCRCQVQRTSVVLRCQSR